MVSWYVYGAIAAIAAGWLAALANLAGYAPIGILSVGTGAVLGACLGALAAAQRIAPGRGLIMGTLLVATLAVASEHYLLYRDFRQQWRAARAKSPQVALFRPETPWSPIEYLQHELTSGRAVIWLVEACVILIAALVSAIVVHSKLSPGDSPSAAT
jgi:hypothetical protein